MTATAVKRRHVLEQLGLSHYEARVLDALATMGTGNTVEIAERSGVPRTSVYVACATLVEAGLIGRELTVRPPSRWVSGGWGDVRVGLITRENARNREQMNLIDGIGA